MDTQGSERIARISLNSALPQLDRLFDYRIPDRLVERVVVGVRVKVPLKHALVEGFVVHITHDSDFVGNLADIAEIVSEVPILQPEIYTLARTIADRNVGSVRDVLRLAIPPRQARVEKAWLSRVDDETEPIADQIDEVLRPVRSRLSTRYGEPLSNALSTSDARIALSVGAGLSNISTGWVPNWSMDLASLAIEVLASDQSTIIVVPDFRDIDAVLRALREYLPEDRILRLDSGQSNAERYRNYLLCTRPEPVVVLGNRSALYAPVSDLGAVLLWDDSDQLHQELLAPYPHNRDVALIRQQLSDCKIIFASHSRSIACQRLVEMNWLTPVRARMTPPRVIIPNGDDVERLRIPSQVMQGIAHGLQTGPVLIQVARPSASRELYPDDRLPTASQTATELGRAFPKIPVVIAEGDRIVGQVTDHPQLVIATRGAEPLADGGYTTVVLLDGLRMMGRESLNVAEDCLRWWSNAAALIRDDSPVYLAGAPNEVAQALSTWRQDRYSSRELAFRRDLRLPPTVRTATLSGDVDPVNATKKKMIALVPVEDMVYLEPTNTHDKIALLVKFPYRLGEQLSNLLREEIIRYAVAKGRYKPRLRVRMDETELIES